MEEIMLKTNVEKDSNVDETLNSNSSVVIFDLWKDFYLLLWIWHHWPRVSGVPRSILHSSVRPLLTSAPCGPEAELQPTLSSFTNWSWVWSEHRHFNRSKKSETWATRARREIQNTNVLLRLKTQQQRLRNICSADLQMDNALICVRQCNQRELNWAKTMAQCMYNDYLFILKYDMFYCDRHPFKLALFPLYVMVSFIIGQSAQELLQRQVWSSWPCDSDVYLIFVFIFVMSDVVKIKSNSPG